MTINAIFAVDKFGGLGFNGSLPWPKNSADLQRFKELTNGHVVVMGRRTWDDELMPKPLPGRITYVASSRPVIGAAVIKGDIKQELLAIEKRHSTKIIWVIGGQHLLDQCSDIFDKLHITHMFDNYKNDVRMNMKQFLTGWSIRTAACDPESRCTYITYDSLFKRS